MSNSSENKRVVRDARLRWVPLGKMRVSPLAQRDLNQARVDRIAANFDPEEIGTPTVNERDDWFYVIDGQHRVEALKQLGWGDEQQVQCWVYVGLTEQEEAEKFLKLNDYLVLHAFPKFRVAVTAQRPAETDIDRIVRSNGLVVSQDEVPGAIAAVGTLVRVYKRADGPTLGRALRIIRDAYGDPGLSAPVIDGIGLLCQRYNGELDEPTAVQRLASAHGGVNGLLGKAEQIRQRSGNYKNHCVAAAAVEIINAGRSKGQKLPAWWKDPA